MTCAWKKYLSIFFALIISTPVFAQTFHGTLSGVIVDSRGAVIANASVQLTNPATGRASTRPAVPSALSPTRVTARLLPVSVTASRSTSSSPRNSLFN
jgi:hypothetical protein